MWWKKLDRIKINDDAFLGDDLTFEQKNLNKLIEKIEEEIENQNVEGKVSYYFTKEVWAFVVKRRLWQKRWPENY